MQIKKERLLGELADLLLGLDQLSLVAVQKHKIICVSDIMRGLDLLGDKPIQRRQIEIAEPRA